MSQRAPAFASLNLIFLLALLATMSVSSVAQCPKSCSCRQDPSSSALIVQCDGLGLSQVPSRSLPPATTALDLSRNVLTMLTTATFQNARALTTLNLSRNHIETIEDGTFGPTQALETLDLSGNRLTSIRQGVFNGFQYLKELDLSSNRLTQVDGAFSGLTNLTTLDLRENSLSALTEFTFRDLESLRYLHLTSNRIQRVDRRTFRSQQRLLYLVMRDNPLEELVTRFYFNSLQLSYVDLSECGLTQIPRGLTDSIRYLQLRRNNLTSLRVQSFSECPYVNILVLDENQIELIEEGTFERMLHLQQLWLNDNRLGTMPRGLPPNLKRLLLDANRLRELGDVFLLRSQLNMLSMVSNQITRVSSDAFSNLDALQSLDLSQNRLTRIEAGTFANNSQIRILQLNKNPLTIFDGRCFEGLANLRELYLGYISAAQESEADDDDAQQSVNSEAVKALSLQDDLFLPVTRLTRLELDNSPGLIASILRSGPVLERLARVQELSIIGSDLSGLRNDFPVFFPALATLRISSVRWHCDKALMWLRDFLLTSTVKVDNKADITCFTPRSLHGRSLIGLGDSEFVPITTTKTTTTTTSSSMVEFIGVQTIDVSQIFDSAPQPSDTEAELDELEKNGWQDYEVVEPDYKPSNHGESDSGAVVSSAFDTARRGGRSTRKPGVISHRPRDSDNIQPSDTVAESDFDNTQHIGQEAIAGDDADKNSKEHRSQSHKPAKGLESPHVLGSRLGSDDDVALDPLRIKIIIAVTTVVATLVIAAIILTLICVVWRRSSHKRRLPEGSASKTQGSERTVIKYRNKNGVLYFSTEDGKESGVQSSAQSLLTMTSPLTSESSTPSASSSMPGVHILSVAPPATFYKTRVYKWEDF